MNRKNINWSKARSQYSNSDYIEDDGYDTNNNCIICHWNRWGPRDVRVCKAFPEGIPPPIWTGKVKHDSPYPGDGGYRFAIAENVPWATEELKKEYPIKEPDSKHQRKCP